MAKVRNIRISIKSEEELFNEVKDVWSKLEKGEKTGKHEGISFESFEAMRKVLTEERLRMPNPTKLTGESHFRLTGIISFKS